jgi:hypothetical protein
MRNMDHPSLLSHPPTPLPQVLLIPLKRESVFPFPRRLLSTFKADSACEDQNDQSCLDEDGGREDSETHTHTHTQIHTQTVLGLQNRHTHTQTHRRYWGLQNRHTHTLSPPFRLCHIWKVSRRRWNMSHGN